MSTDRDMGKEIKLLGVMTGTSCDGLDASCVSITPDSWGITWQDSIPYPKTLRDRVIRLQKPKSNHDLKSILELDRDLGIWYGKALSQLIRKHKGPDSEGVPHIIANHGQTVAHFPKIKAA